MKNALVERLQQMKLEEVRSRMQKITEALAKNKILCFACLSDCSEDFHAVQIEKGKKAALCPTCFKKLNQEVS